MDKMDKYDVAVIGAGLGGLQCAYILAKRGLKVVVLEKNSQYIGGCLQAFRRSGSFFDTGFHYVGGLDDGQPLNKLFQKFGLMDLPWVRMDLDCFDEVVYMGKSYKIPQGFQRFAAQMKEYFPDSALQIDKYTEFLKDVAENLLDTFGKNMGTIHEHPLFTRKALDFLNENISDPVLRNVLSGTSPKIALHDNLPLYVFAQINASFINSAYRLKTHGMSIAEHLAKDIEAFGGRIVKGACVTSIADFLDDCKVLEISGMDPIYASKVVSNIHPSRFNEILPESVSKKLARRLKKCTNSFGMFTVNVSLKPSAIKYQNHNIYIHNSENIWAEGQQEAASEPSCALISFRYPESGDTATNIDILTPMRWDDVAEFATAESAPMRRCTKYDGLKRTKAEQLIDLASKYVPGLREAVAGYYTSTPLTYRDYTGTECGSAFGINKDSDSLLYTMPAPMVAKDIYQCGQNCGLHGILGVTMTACIACMAILQKDNLLDIFGE